MHASEHVYPISSYHSLRQSARLLFSVPISVTTCGHCKKGLGSLGNPIQVPEKYPPRDMLYIPSLAVWIAVRAPISTSTLASTAGIKRHQNIACRVLCL